VTQLLSRPSTRYIVLTLIGLTATLLAVLLPGTSAHAATVDDNGFSIDINGPDGTPSSSVVTLIGITILSIAPSLIMLCTSFTKIFIVLVILRNAIGLPAVPPNQVLAGISLFLTLFIMNPVITEIWNTAATPYMDGTATFDQAVDTGTVPLKEWMLALTRESDIALITRAAGAANPATPEDLDMVTLIPAFLLSELRSAFIIGFVIVLPFLIIDIVVAAVTMSMGMMMLPPTIISIAVKIGFVVLSDTWAVVTTSLIGSYR
jgi:flagellar biosynthetic protein FliP